MDIGNIDILNHTNGVEGDLTLLTWFYFRTVYFRVLGDTITFYFKSIYMNEEKVGNSEGSFYIDYLKLV